MGRRKKHKIVWQDSNLLHRLCNRESSWIPSPQKQIPPYCLLQLQALPQNGTRERTKKLHYVESCTREMDVSDDNLQTLWIAIKSCACLKCQGKINGMCEYTEYWQEKEIWVKEELDEPGSQTKQQSRQPTIKLMQVDKEKLVLVTKQNSRKATN